MGITGRWRIFSAACLLGLTTIACGQAPETQTVSLESDVAALKTENAALRDQLNKVEEQQRVLLEVVNDLKQRLGSPATSTTGGPSTSSQRNSASTGELATSVSNIPVPHARAMQPESVTVARAVQPEAFPFARPAQPESF